MWFKILVSCVPAAVIGILFDDLFNRLFYNPVCVSIALIVFGVAFIIIERWNKGRSSKVNALSEIGYNTAILISMVVLKFLMAYIKKHDFQVFGWYRIVLGAIILICGIAGVINV